MEKIEMCNLPENNEEKIHKRILDFQKALFKTWPDECFLSSLVLNFETGIDWIMNNLVQICAYKVSRDYPNIRLNFFPSCKHHFRVNLYDYCPFLDKYSLPNDVINECFGSFSLFVKYSVSRDYYVSTTVNQFFRDRNSEEELLHPIYIYGFDDEKRIIYTADCYENWKYNTKEVSMEDMDVAFSSLQMKTREEFVRRTYLYKLRMHNYSFNLNSLLDLLEDYRFSRDSSGNSRYSTNKVFGIACFEEILKSFDLLNDGDEIDLKSLVFMTDSMSLMKMRVEYLMNKGYLAKDDEEYLNQKMMKNIDTANINLMLAMKYNQRRCPEVITKICKNIEEIINEEMDIMDFLLPILKNTIEGSEND